MTTNEPGPEHDRFGYSASGQQPLPQQTNPTWLGQIQPEYYQRAPANNRGQFQPDRKSVV